MENSSIAGLNLENPEELSEESRGEVENILNSLQLVKLENEVEGSITAAHRDVLSMVNRYSFVYESEDRSDYDDDSNLARLLLGVMEIVEYNDCETRKLWKDILMAILKKQNLWENIRKLSDHTKMWLFEIVATCEPKSQWSHSITVLVEVFGKEIFIEIASEIIFLYRNSEAPGKRSLTIILLLGIASRFTTPEVDNYFALHTVVALIENGLKDLDDGVSETACLFIISRSDLKSKILEHTIQTILPALFFAFETKPRLKHVAACALLEAVTVTKMWSAKLSELSRYANNFNSLLKRLLEANNENSDRELAFCFFNMLTQLFPKEHHNLYKDYVPVMIKACSDENHPRVQKEAINGVRFVCVNDSAKKLFMPFSEDALFHLNSAAHYPLAICAMGDIIWFHHASIPNAAKVFSHWLKYLPIRDDLRVAQAAHERLRLLVDRYFDGYGGSEGESIRQAIGIIFLQIIDQGNLLSDTLRGMKKFIKDKLLNSPYFLEGLSPKKKMILETKILEDT